MNYWQQNGTNDQAWDYLTSSVCPDVAFLQETVVPERFTEMAIFHESETCKTTELPKWGTCLYFSENILKTGSISDVTDKYIDSEKHKGKQVFVEFESNNGTSITLCSLHTNTSPDGIYTIRSHIESIFNATVLSSKSRFIIGGDFNADTVMVNGFFSDIFDKIGLHFHECCPVYSQTFFGANMSEENHYQDDHIFVSKDLSIAVEKTFSWNYGKVKNYSDHTILETKINI